MINPYDFRANQIQTNQIISSGSSGTNAKIIIYPVDKQSTSNPNEGIIDSSKFNTSSIGTDIFLYVSGGIGQRNTANANSITAFGGDVYISGNLFVSGTNNISSSASSSDSFWQSTSNNIIFTTGSVIITGSATITGNLATNGTASFGSTPISSFGSNVQTYFSGTLNRVPNGPNQRNTVFASDVVFSGTILLRTSSLNPVNYILGPNGDGGFVFSGSLLSIAAASGTQIGGLSGQGAVLPITQQDANFFISGTIGGKDSSTRGITVIGGDLHVSGNISSTAGVVGSQWIEGSTSPQLRTTASVAIGSGTVFAENVGTDVFFYVSGSVSSGSATDNVSVFGGSVRVSGVLTVGSASIRIDSNSVVFSSASHATGSIIRVEDTANGAGLSGRNNLTIAAGRTVATGSGGSVSIIAGNAGYTYAAGMGTAGGNIILTTGQAAFATGSANDYGDGGFTSIGHGKGGPSFSSKIAGRGGLFTVVGGVGGDGAPANSGLAGPGGPGGNISLIGGVGGIHEPANGSPSAITALPGDGGDITITGGAGGIAIGSGSADLDGTGGQVSLVGGAGSTNYGWGYGRIGGDIFLSPGIGGVGFVSQQSGPSTQAKDGDLWIMGNSRSYSDGGLSGSNVGALQINRFFINANTSINDATFPGRDIGFYVSGTRGTVPGVVDNTRKTVFGGDSYISGSATISGTMLTVDGGLTDPAWAFIGEPGTGMRRRASQQLAVVAGGADTWIFSNLTFQAPNAGTIGAGFNSSLTLDGNTTSGLSGLILKNSQTNVAASGLQRTVDIQSTVSQSSTAAFAALKVSTLQQATGSGRQLALSVQLSSSQGDREVFSVSSNGNLIASGSGIFRSGLTGALNVLPDGANFVIGAGGLTTSTASNGQITVNASALSTSIATDISGLYFPRNIVDGTGVRYLSVSDNNCVIEMAHTLSNVVYVPPGLPLSFNTLLIQTNAAVIQVQSTASLKYPTATFLTASAEQWSVIGIISGSQGTHLFGDLQLA
jgi:hypothetical protein